MTPSSWVLCAIATFVVVINLVTLRRLWASPIFERPQKIAQTILLWVVPGSFLAVRYVLREQRVRRSVNPTTGAAILVWENAWNYLPGGGHDGSFGGHHGHDAGSAGFSGDNGGGSNDGGGWGGGGGSDGGAGGGGADGGAG
jgi:uncharacterized membrane protein YgcG